MKLIKTCRPLTLTQLFSTVFLVEHCLTSSIRHLNLFVLQKRQHIKPQHSLKERKHCWKLLTRIKITLLQRGRGRQDIEVANALKNLNSLRKGKPGFSHCLFVLHSIPYQTHFFKNDIQQFRTHKSVTTLEFR